MTELNEFDIEKAFADSFKETSKNETKSRDCYPYSSFNACRYQGTLIGKIIPAKSKDRIFIYKTLNNVLMGSIPFKREDGSDQYRGFRVISASDYECQLTAEQRTLNENLIKELNTYNELMVSKGGSQWEPIKNKKRVSFFYMMIRRYIDKDGKKTDYTDPNVTCVFHTSYNFSEKFDSAVKNRTDALESNSWLINFFGNTPGTNDKFTLIKTDRPTFAYEIGVTFEELPALKFDVKEDDLRTAESLDEAFVNTMSYDYDFYKEIYDRVVELNKGLANDPVIIDAPEIDRTNHNAE